MARKDRRGQLSPEDRALWAAVTETTTPLVKRHSAPLTNGKKANVEQVSVKGEKRAKPVKKIQILPPTLGASPKSSAPRMDARAFSKLKRGRLRPEAHIDLHGMTVPSAHTALSAFILKARADGKRLVLVITGKGRAAETTREVGGVLRRKVPHWLEIPPLAQAVLQIESAHQRHGGSGAYYVYLRRGQ